MTPFLAHCATCMLAIHEPATSCPKCKSRRLVLVTGSWPGRPRSVTSIPPNEDRRAPRRRDHRRASVARERAAAAKRAANWPFEPDDAKASAGLLISGRDRETPTGPTIETRPGTLFAELMGEFWADVAGLPEDPEHRLVVPLPEFTEWLAAGGSR